MKKKATLLIKNIERIYTMKELNGKQLVLRHAYIAIHHEEIIAMACGDFSSYIDKDTRILDGRSHIAIPGFIEADTTLPAFEAFEEVRKQLECLMHYMHHGTLSVRVKDIHAQLKKHYAFEILEDTLENSRYPVVYGISTIQQNKRIAAKNFCISSYAAGYEVYSQLAVAQMLQIRYNIDAWRLLKALTIHPAKRLGLKKCGRLDVGMQADILLLSCENIQALFHMIGNEHIAHIIKKGVRVFPNLLI